MITLRSVSKKHRFFLVAGAIGAILLLGLSACGGGGNAETAPSPQQIAHFKKLGAAHVHKEERLRRLEQELKHIKRTGAPVPTVQTQRVESTPEPSSAPAVPATESCGGEISVNSDTSCPFAENVENAYYEEVESGAGTVEAYSPVTEKLYAMSCSGSPHECVGGNNAVVYFP